MFKCPQIDTFFITYDEPKKDEFWEKVKQALPHAKRIDGVKGFDTAYKECARQATSYRFFTIDGDNKILPQFSSLKLSWLSYWSRQVFSWSAINSINGLSYGNGGVKCWPKNLVLKMKSHEAAEETKDLTDFCNSLNYYQKTEPLSVSVINSTPHQAFRAGFREGVKMCLNRGLSFKSSGNDNPREWLTQLSIANIERLKVWCSVGSDVPNGLWAIYGARLGALMLLRKEVDETALVSHDWINALWEKMKAYDLLEQLPRLEQELSRDFLLSVVLMSPADSAFFKSVYVNSPRTGTMFSPCFD